MGGHGADKGEVVTTIRCLEPFCGYPQSVTNIEVMVAGAAGATCAEPMKAPASCQRVPKVFFIGPNKSGTTSWKELMEALGATVLHEVHWAFASRHQDRAYFDRADAFLDGSRFNVEWLVRAAARPLHCPQANP